MNKRAFTLVELMVVVGIVSLLTTIAIPNFNKYLIRSRIAAGINAIKTYVDMEVDYYNTNGQFANGAELAPEGLTINANTYDVTNYQDVYPYSSRMIINRQCSNQRAEVGIHFSNASVGVPGPLYVYYAVDYVNGVAKVRCVIHDNTTYTAVASRSYVPANCQTLLAPGTCDF